MGRVNLEQRTPEWHAWREDKIGSSNIAAIYVANPYKSPQDVYDEWISGNKVEVDNEHVRRGVKLEPRALELYNEISGSTYHPICWESDEDSRFIASLDGYRNDTHEAVEIKCPTLANFKKFNFKIPEMYIVQMNWQMFVCGLDEMEFFTYVVDPIDGERWATHTVPRDDVLIQKLKLTAYDFLKRVNSFEPLEAKHQTIPDHLQSYIESYKLLSQEIKEKETALKGLRDVILSDCGEGYYEGYGIDIGLRKGSTTYDYKQMAQDGIDLEKYKKVGKGSSYIKVKE